MVGWIIVNDMHRQETGLANDKGVQGSKVLQMLQSIEYGTNVVGGVSPNKTGQHLGLPLYSTVRKAVSYLKPDATSIFVSAIHAAYVRNNGGH